jgi:hypothetical protein
MKLPMVAEAEYLLFHPSAPFAFCDVGVAWATKVASVCYG